MDSLNILIGLITGVVITFILVKLLASKNETADTTTLERTISEKQDIIRNLEIEKATLQSELNSATEQKNKALSDLHESNLKVTSLTSENATLTNQEKNLTESNLELTHLKTTLTQQREQLLSEKSELSSQVAALTEINSNYKKQQKEIAEVEKRFSTEFENISARLIKENTKTLNESNSDSLKTVLDPLKENLENFKKNIDLKYVNEEKSKERLKTEIEQLVSLNKQLSDDTHNLTKALTGSNKHQGNWGEIILERVLERSGLNKGQEYKLQEHITSEDGSRRIPDAVVFLPDDKHIIIDSKVSLTAYQRMVNAEDEVSQLKELKLHVASLKSHIKELGEKTYYDTAEYNSPDFTLMFLPIEASFSVALREDTELFNFAWEKNIVIVSPTTLLATLRTIQSTWKHERQNRNVLEIARVGGTLYDKFVGLVEDLQKIEKGIKSSQSAYDAAFNKLSSGKGNVISQTEKLKSLGAKAKKALPSELIEEQNALFIESDSDE